MKQEQLRLIEERRNVLQERFDGITAWDLTEAKEEVVMGIDRMKQNLKREIRNMDITIYFYSM